MTEAGGIGRGPAKARASAPKRSRPKSKPRGAAPEASIQTKKQKQYTGGGASESAAAERKKGRSGGAAGGAFAIHPAMLAVEAKQKPTAERLAELRAAFASFHERRHASGYMPTTPEWGDAIEALERTGVTPGAHVGTAFLPGGADDATYVPKVEWYLGQVLGLARAANDSMQTDHLDEVMRLAEGLSRIETGRDLGAELKARDAARERHRRDFIAEHRKSGMLESAHGQSSDYQTLFGGYGISVEAQIGRRVAVLIADPKSGDLRELTGRMGPDPENRYGFFTVGEGERRVTTCFNEVKAFLVEDSSPIDPKRFAAAMKARGFIQSRSPERSETFPLGFTPWDMAGRRFAALLVDETAHEWRSIEGVLRVDPRPGDALFQLEIDGALRPMNINDAQAWAVEDTSAIPPAEFERRVEKAGLMKVGSAEHRALFGASFYGKEHDGRRASLLEVDPKSHVYLVTEGVLRAGPHGGFDARYAIESGGALAEKSIGEAKELYVEDTSPIRPAEFRRAMKKRGLAKQASFDPEAMAGKYVSVLMPDKVTHQWRTYEGQVRLYSGPNNLKLTGAQGEFELRPSDIQELWA